MVTDADRIDFLAKHCLCVSENDNGEWQVSEFVPTYYSDGIVTRNSFLASAREAIDYAIAYYPGGDRNRLIEKMREVDAPQNAG